MNAVGQLFESISQIDIPSAYRFLFEPAPYKVIYGGRNAGKDWNVVRVDLILGMMYNPAYTKAEIDEIEKMFARDLKIKTGLIRSSLLHPHRFMYCREVMESIKKSVYTTIKDQIIDLGLSSKWKIKDASIECINGSDMIFAGLYRDPHNIKSAEGVSMCRVIEAENVSEDSWKYLIPTIRKDNSEILVSFNTRYEDDPTYERWVAHPPKEAVVKLINSTDIEDYLTQAAKLNRKNDYALRKYEYPNVWEGQPLGKGRRIYPMFKEDIIVKRFERQWLKERPRIEFFQSCDPAQQYYPASLWCARFYDDLGCMIKYIYSEYPMYSDFGDYFCNIRHNILYTGTIADLSRIFKVKDGFNEWGFQVRERYIDTRFSRGTGAKSYFSGDTLGIVGEFAKTENGGLEFLCPEPKIIDAQKDQIIKDMEFNADAPQGPYNHPKIYIDPGCINLIYSLARHRLKENSEEEDQKHKDFPDALKILYAGMSTTDFEGQHSQESEVSLFTGAGICLVNEEHSENWMRA